MNNLFDKGGAYTAEVYVASKRNGILSWAIAGGWCVFPFAVAAVFWPSDVVRVQSKLAGLPRPHSFTAAQLTAGFIEALFVLAALGLFQLVATVLFYRRAKLEESGPVAVPPLWPLAAIVAGVFGNLAWLIGTAQFDLAGCLIGLSSAALTVGGEVVCEKLGRDFVFGTAASAQPQSW
jgi:hypothetical protein